MWHQCIVSKEAGAKSISTGLPIGAQQFGREQDSVTQWSKPHIINSALLLAPSRDWKEARKPVLSEVSASQPASLHASRSGAGAAVLVLTGGGGQFALLQQASQQLETPAMQRSSA